MCVLCGEQRVQMSDAVTHAFGPGRLEIFRPVGLGRTDLATVSDRIELEVVRDPDSVPRSPQILMLDGAHHFG